MVLDWPDQSFHLSWSSRFCLSPGRCKTSCQTNQLIFTSSTELNEKCLLKWLISDQLYQIPVVIFVSFVLKIQIIWLATQKHQVTCDAWAKSTVRISLGTETLSLHYKIISIDVIIQCRFIRLINNITTTSLLKLGNSL